MRCSYERRTEKRYSSSASSARTCTRLGTRSSITRSPRRAFDVVNLGVMVSQEEVYRGRDRSGRGRHRGILALRTGRVGLPRHAGKSATKLVLPGFRCLSAGILSSASRISQTWKSASRPWALTVPFRLARRRRRPSLRCGRFCITKRGRNEACIIDGFWQYLYKADCR